MDSLTQQILKMLLKGFKKNSTKELNKKLELKLNDVDLGNINLVIEKLKEKETESNKQIDGLKKQLKECNEAKEELGENAADIQVMTQKNKTLKAQLETKQNELETLETNLNEATDEVNNTNDRLTSAKRSQTAAMQILTTDIEKLMKLSQFSDDEISDANENLKKAAEFSAFLKNAEEAFENIQKIETNDTSFKENLKQLVEKTAEHLEKLPEGDLKNNLLERLDNEDTSASDVQTILEEAFNANTLHLKKELLQEEVDESKILNQKDKLIFGGEIEKANSLEAIDVTKKKITTKKNEEIEKLQTKLTSDNEARFNTVKTLYEVLINQIPDTYLSNDYKTTLFEELEATGNSNDNFETLNEFKDDNLNGRTRGLVLSSIEKNSAQ